MPCTPVEASEVVVAKGCWGWFKMDSFHCVVMPEMEPISPASFPVGIKALFGRGSSIASVGDGAGGVAVVEVSRYCWERQDGRNGARWRGEEGKEF